MPGYKKTAMVRLSMVFSAKIVVHQIKGAYTETVDIGPELMQILMSTTKNSISS